MRSIFVIVILLTPTSAWAEILLAEFTFDDFEFGGFGSDPPSTFRYDFSIGAQYVGRWRNVSLADVGQTFIPEPD